MNEERGTEAEATTKATVTRDPNGHTVISVGELYPGPLPSMGSQIGLMDVLSVMIRLHGLSKEEVKAFRRLDAYGFYAAPDFPHGLLLWKFAGSLLFETPFNPRLEETMRPDEVRAFLRGKANICRRTLLDEHGTVKAFGFLGMDWELVDILKKTWGDPTLDWSDYDERYKRLASRASIKELWDKARTWRVKNHPMDGDDGESEHKEEPRPCGKCEANGAAIARLKESLKEAERRDAEQRQRMAELQSQASLLAKDKAGLLAKVASLSVGPLQQEVAVLKALVEEKDFRILEVEDEVLACDRKAKSLDGQVDDLGRRIKWLEHALRVNGIAFS